MYPKLLLPTEDIIRQYTIERKHAQTIATNYGVSIGVVRRILRENNIPMRSRGEAQKARVDLERLRYMYSILRLSTPRIAKTLGLTFTTILRILHENNINVRTSSRTRSERCFVLKPNIALKIVLTHRRIEYIRYAYLRQHLTTNQIKTNLNISSGCLRNIMRHNNIPIRKNHETRIVLHHDRIHNKGSIDYPILGDERKGSELGFKTTNFYKYVACNQCHSLRWEVKHRISITPLCKPCAMAEMGKHQRGENAPGWKGGISFLPYPPEFNHARKELIRERDNYICQLCGLPQNGHRLAIHHIDYDKNNLNDSNLISLCQSPCHNKTNGNRLYWKCLFQAKILSKTLALPMPCS